MNGNVNETFVILLISATLIPIVSFFVIDFFQKKMK